MDKKPVYSTPPPITGLINTQQIASGSATPGKITNVFMPNQQQAIMEYVSEPYIPEEIELLRPIETMLIKKRAIGIETEVESAINDIDFDAISLFRKVGGEDLALDMALSYIHSREGLRTRNGFERDHQVMQKTLETLTTYTHNEKTGGILSRIGNFMKGNKPSQPTQGQQ